MAVSCAAPSPRQDVQQDSRRAPIVVTTIGATEFLARELLHGVAETRLLGLQVPRNQRAEPTPGERVMIERSTLIVAYGGNADRNSVAMVRRAAPDKTLLIVRGDAPANAGFGWLDPATLREDARNLHELLQPHFDTSRQRGRLEANLAALEVRLHELEESLTDLKGSFAGRRVFTDDRRMHPFLHSLGMEVIHTIEIDQDGRVAEAQGERVAALSAEVPARILIVTHPEKKEHLAELATEADLTLVYFNPFLDGVTGVGQLDTVIPRQLAVLWLVFSSAMAAHETQ